MGRILDTLIDILKELKIIRKHLESITKREYVAGKRFDF